MLAVRDIDEQDLKGLLELYTHLHEKEVPELDARVLDIWREILSNPNHHIIIGCMEEKIVSSCVTVIIPNLTHQQRPYALVENVVTHEDYRGKGYATQLLNYAKELAIRENCYKIMLMTGSKKDSTLNFYRKAGYNSEDKTGFIQWL